MVPECHCTGFDVGLRINRDGQIVVSGETAETTVTAFLLEPIRPRFGDVTADCRVGIEDLLQLLRDWGSSEVPTDLDEDGSVNVRDLLSMLGNWG